MARQYLLGVDAGTSVIKAVVFDLDGHELGIGKRNLTMVSSRPGWAEVDMDAVWQGAAAAIRKALLDADIPPGEIAGVGVCGQGDGAWLVDETGRPVRNAALWNDNRSAPIIDRWQQNGTLQECYRILGTVLWPGSLAALLDWLRQNEPQSFTRIRWAFCCKDWINYRLTNVVGTEESDASIPFSAIETRKYDERLLRILGFTGFMGKLPPIHRSASLIGYVSKEASTVTGLAPGTPVAAGAVDVYANALGVGVIDPGQSLTILGTTSVASVVMDRPNIQPFDIGATVCHVLPDRWMRALGTSAGTPNLDWFLDQVGLPGRRRKIDYELCNRLVDESPIGARGVLYLPFLMGERAPFLQPAATAGFLGVSSSTQRSDLLRAVYEGVALSIKDCYQAIGSRIDRVVLTGGGARSEAWSQILANVLDCQIDLPLGSELGAKGAAMLAGICIGLYPGFREAVERTVRVEKSYYPDTSITSFYDELYSLYHDLTRQLEPFWIQRAGLLEKMSTTHIH